MRLDDGVQYVPLTIMVGGTYEGGFDLVDETGAPILGVTDGWVGRMEVREDINGGLLATFATTGGDGTLDIDDNGHCIITLPSTFTETLQGSRVRTGRADVEVWQTSAPTVRHKPPVVFRVYIRPEVTTG